jgi:hypothetical protein
MSATNLCLSRSFREKEGDLFVDNIPSLAATARVIGADVNLNCPTGMRQITAEIIEGVREIAVNLGQVEPAEITDPAVFWLP